MAHLLNGGCPLSTRHHHPLGRHGKTARASLAELLLVVQRAADVELPGQRVAQLLAQPAHLMVVGSAPSRVVVAARVVDREVSYGAIAEQI